MTFSYLIFQRVLMSSVLIAKKSVKEQSGFIKVLIWVSSCFSLKWLTTDKYCCSMGFWNTSVRLSRTFFFLRLMYYCSLEFQMYLMPFPSAHIAAIQCYMLCRIITMSPKCPGLCFRSLAFIKQLPGFGWHGLIHQVHDNKEVKLNKVPTLN